MPSASPSATTCTGAGAISRLDHFNIVTPDVPAAQRYYEGLGFTVSEDIEDADGTVYAAPPTSAARSCSCATTSGRPAARTCSSAARFSYTRPDEVGAGAGARGFKLGHQV